MKKLFALILALFMGACATAEAAGHHFWLPGSRDGMYIRDYDATVTKVYRKDTKNTDWAKVFEDGFVVWSENSNHAILDGLGGKELSAEKTYVVIEEQLVEVDEESIDQVLEAAISLGIVQKGELKGKPYWTVNCEDYDSQVHTEVYRIYFTETEYISVFERSTDQVLTLCRKAKKSKKTGGSKPPVENPPAETTPADPTPTPTPTAKPTATPVDPGRPEETPKPTPTATPTAKPTATPTAKPTATPAPTNPLSAEPQDPGRPSQTAKPTAKPTEKPTSSGNPLASPQDPGRGSKPVDSTVAVQSNPLENQGGSTPANTPVPESGSLPPAQDGNPLAVAQDPGRPPENNCAI